MPVPVTCPAGWTAGVRRNHRGHVQTGPGLAAISGLPPGKPDKDESPEPAWEHLGDFPQAFTRLALIEADQNDRDYAALQAAVKDGRVQTTTNI